MLGFPLNFLNQKPQETDNRTSLKAQKTLSLKDWKEGQASLNLRKRAIQTILKKHRSKKVPEGLLDRNKLLLCGLSSQVLRLSGKSKRYYDPQEIYGSQLIQYQKIMKNSRNIREIYMANSLNLPLRLLHTFQVLQSLRVLALRLTASQFLFFSRSLHQNKNLRELSVVVNPIEENESFDSQKAKKTLVKVLKGLPDLHLLKKLDINMGRNEAFHTGEIATLLFKGLGNLDLLSFDIVLPIPTTEDFDAEQGQIFFAKVESLILDQPLFFWNHAFVKRLTFSHNKNLPQESIIIPRNFKDVLTRCSSLKYLFFAPQSICGRIPETWGLAKGLTSLEFYSVNEANRAEISQQLANLLREAEKLEDFKITFPLTENWIEFITPVHCALEKLPLKSYSFVPNGDMNLSILETLCKLLSKIKTIEKMDSEWRVVDNLEITKTFFEHFPKLKQLSLVIVRTDSESLYFPVESLAALESIEELAIRLPIVDKDDFLQRLPKLPCLKKIFIAQCFNNNSQITTEDYQKKFNL